jgi:hypothetical protein
MAEWASKIRKLVTLVILGVLLICCISRGLRSPRQQSSTQVPVATYHYQPPPTRPPPTPRQPITGPSAEELRTKWDEMTDLQRGAYHRGLIGAYVRWTAEVTEVHASGTVNALAMAGTKALVIVFDLPLNEARRLDKDQAVTFEGTIHSIVVPKRSGENLLEDIAQSLSLIVELRDVTVLPSR